MNKSLLFLAFLFLFFTQTKAQTSVYHPFPDSNAVWEVNYGGYQCNCCALYQYSFDGDTLINAIIYHKIHQQGIQFLVDVQTGYCTTLGFFSIDQYACAMRVDNNLKKVYIVPPGSTTDSLLYDFMLSVGDTLRGYISSCYPPATVMSIDSILIGNNYRKEWHFNNNESIIEGIGGINGLIETACTFEQGGQLVCFSQNKIGFYGDTTCVPLGTNEISSENFMSLYPNPAYGQLTIHTSSFQNEPVTVSVLNVLGQKASPPVPLQRRGQDAVIDVSGLAAGMYFLQLQTESGSVVKRFVKQ